jgi:uncharacterized protein YjbI with pentapeptide repeats
MPSGSRPSLAAGLYLWVRDEHKGWGDLGEGIMVSVIVAIALMAVQRDADDRTREATERRDSQLHAADVRRERNIREADAAQQKTAERASLQLSLTMQTDLRGIALADRDMHGFFLARKDFTGADLHGANLASADLRGGRFKRTDLVGANLDKARMRSADLRDAILLSPERLLPGPGHSTGSKETTFRGAELEGADLRGMGLSGANFTDADLIGADLRSFAQRSLDLRSSGVGFIPMPAPKFRRAILIFADVSDSDLTRVDLRGAYLLGARFCGVRGLRTTKLDGARYDASTRWPPGFNPVHGALRFKPKPDADLLARQRVADDLAPFLGPSPCG